MQDTGVVEQTAIKSYESSKPQTFDVISQDRINSYTQQIQDKTGVDLSGLKVSITRPGEALFDKEEIKYKYFTLIDNNPQLEPLAELIGQYEDDSEKVSIEKLRESAKSLGIMLEGRLPGFALTSEDNHIVFLSIQEKDILSMAQKYAVKEGEQKSFTGIDEAKSYLESIAERAFFHEVGHVVYSQREQEGKVSGWETFVDSSPEIQEQVGILQEDKHPDEDIPTADEAFADFFMDAATNGRLTSRLTNRLSQQAQQANIISAAHTNAASLLKLTT